MKPWEDTDGTVYVIALTVQADTDTGVFTRHRLGWMGLPKTQRQPAEHAIQWMREKLGMDSPDYRVVAHYVGLANPFGTPTRCLIAITLMPGGVGFAARLRQRRREYTISDDFTLIDAFDEMLDEETSDSVIGYSVTPVELLP